ncbi:hypothetical protein N7457_000855 [Penicillium paradoxum]|uniref:uncharacterized protein n=1 Tax=Penicillium paradoxum TaxID=176176 RepID=UPI0025492530|nr:uncharacterized protein N7457_000855 [Penicillium paradoxum]KAJ5794256.1 hypothetical protein N7457_000855 [Penicillium paradoxum]
MDNGKEFSVFVKWAREQSMMISPSVPYAHEQNGSTRNVMDQGLRQQDSENENLGSTIDLCLTSWDIRDQVAHTRPVQSLAGLSDHLPLETELNTSLTPSTPPKRRNWKRMDPDKLKDTLHRSLTQIPTPQATRPSIDTAVSALTDAVQAAVDASTPWLRPTALSQPGFTPECRQIQKEARRTHRQIVQYQARWRERAPDTLWSQYYKLKRTARRRIQRMRNTTHQKRITEAGESGEIKQIWNLAKWARDRTPFQSYTPPYPGIRRAATVPPRGKGQSPLRLLLPTPPAADLSDTRRFRYPEPVQLPEITAQEVKRAIHQPGGFKAAGPDGIINAVLQTASDLLAPPLANLYNTCIAAGYCPTTFREARTIALRKPGKDDYSKPKSYRPIALLNTMGKVMEGVIALRLSYLVETYGLLPRNHFGGRKGQGCDTALHAVTEEIREAWKQGLTASTLLLDISGAFDNVSHPRLLHNLRKRRVPPVIIKWVESFLSDRYTTLEMPEYTRPREGIDTGIPQGSPLSPILFLFYNADMMGPKQHSNNYGYIDDTTMIAVGNSPQANCRALALSFRECDTWAKQHASVFAPEKFALVHFEPPERRHADPDTTTPPPPVDLGNGRVVEASESAKLLGVIIDSQLTFDKHLDQVEKKCTKSLQAISALGRSKWGLNIHDKRLIYNTCIAPKALYGSSVWAAPPVSTDGRPPTDAKSQGSRRSKDVPRTPMASRLEEDRLKALTRLATSPAYRAIRARRTYHRKRALHPAMEIAEEDLLLEGEYNLDQMEIRHPFAVPPEAAFVHWVNCTISPLTPRIYTDGSGHHGEVGGSAYHKPAQGPAIERMAYFGTEHHHNVHAAEIGGLILALRMAEDNPQLQQGIDIYSDNQSALQVIRNPRQNSGQYLIKEVVRLIDLRRQKGWATRFFWIPAHWEEEIEGNTQADALAKKATGWRAEERDTLGTRADWANPPTGAPGRELRRVMPFLQRRGTEIFTGLTAPERSALIQARTGHIGLNAVLFRWGKVDSPTCPACQEHDETVNHVLFLCPAHSGQRDQIWGPQLAPRTLAHALGPDHAKKTARFLLGTGRLPYLLPPPPILDESDTNTGN